MKTTRVMMLAAALLLASQSALAQDSEEDDVAQMERVEVTGGGIGGVNDLVFLESEEGDDAWMDETRRTESE